MPLLENVINEISQERLWSRHLQLAEIGATPGGGVNRQALSREEISARQLLVQWGSPLGLVPYSDDIGNLFLRYPGKDADAAPVVTGSHIDTQPTGGRFDGSFGVLAGLEMLEAMHAAQFKPERSIEIVAWTNEEGSRFAPGMMGSALFRGQRDLESMLQVEDLAGISVRESVAAVRAAEPDIASRSLGFPIAAYVEAHIEQGPILEMQRKIIGVVSGIQGKRVFRVTVEGEENHAGTSPRTLRKDALVASVDILSALHALTHDPDDTVKFTVGFLEVSPNAPSVVPSLVHFSIDLRHPDTEILSSLGDAIPALCEEHRGPCNVQIKELSNDPSLEFPAAIRDVIRDVVVGLDIAHMELPSAAGHDARHLHYVCPTGMIFVPCAGGISHNEAESCKAEDLFNGAQVLAGTIARLADQA